MLVYAITSQKDGVGKTTTTSNLGAALLREGRRTLLLDMDPQADLTAVLGKTAGGASMSDVLLGSCDITDAIQPCACGLDLVAAGARLSVVLLQLALWESPAQRLRHALRFIRDRYDYVLIDCPPTLGHATTNALTAADVAMVPLQCEYLALRGLVDVDEIVTVIRETTNPGLRLRIIGTMLDQRNVHSHDVLGTARSVYPGRFYTTYIPRTVRLAEAPATGRTIFEYAPDSGGADAYRRLALEIIEEEPRIEQTKRNPGSDAELALLRMA
jgi:chromosome partitioning protein